MAGKIRLAAPRESLRLVRLRESVEVQAARIKEASGFARLKLVGREAYLANRKSPYCGRLGKITGIMPDANHGIMCCFMVYRMGTREPLNSNAESRMYRPFDHLWLVGEGGD